MLIYCNGCGKHFDIVITGKGPANYQCPACGKVQVFELEAIVNKAMEPGMKMLGKRGGRRQGVGLKCGRSVGLRPAAMALLQDASGLFQMHSGLRNCCGSQPRASKARFWKDATDTLTVPTISTCIRP